MFSGVAWVLMSDVTMTLLLPLIDVKVVFLNPGLSSSPLLILIYLFYLFFYLLIVKKKKVNFLCRCGHRKFFLHRLRRSYNAYAIAIAKIQRCSDKNPTAFAPNVRTFAAMFRSAPNTGAVFSAIFARVFANLLVALAPLFMAFLAPTTIVVTMPATEMATIAMPPMFPFAHLLKRSNLVRSLFSTSSSTMLRASSLSGRWFLRTRISSAFNAATSAIAS